MARQSDGTSGNNLWNDGGTLLGGVDNWCIAFWFKSGDTTQTNRYVAAFGSGGEQKAIIYGYNFDGPDADIEFFASSGFTGTDPRTGSRLTIEDTDWHHVAYKKLTGAGEWAFFLDGVKTVINGGTSITLDSHVVLDTNLFNSASHGASAFNGHLFDFRVWTGTLPSDAEIAEMAAENLSSDYAAAGQIAGWLLDGDDDPEPDDVGSLHLANTGTIQSTSPFTVAEESVPSSFPLVSSGKTYRRFIFNERSDAALGAAQGVGYDGTNYYYTGGQGVTPNHSRLYKATKNGSTFSLHPGPATNPVNTSLYWTGTISQSNHILYHDPQDGDGARLFIGGNNYNTTPAEGVIMEFDPDTLEYLRIHDVAPHWNEGGAFRPGTNEFWAVYDEVFSTNTWKLTRYNYVNKQLTNYTEFELDADFNLGGSGYPNTSDPGGDFHFHNAIWWLSKTLVLITIHEGTRPSGVELWEYDVSSGTFSYVQRIRTPTKQCSQGLHGDPTGSDPSFFAFAERFYPTGSGTDHRILTANLRSIIVPNGLPTGIDNNHAQAQGLLAWYPMSEGAGTTIKDLVTGNTSNISGPTWTEDSVMGNVLEFDGVNDFIDISTTAFSSALSEAMVMFWVKPSVLLSDSRILISGNASGSNSGDWQVDTDLSGAEGLDFFYNNGTTLNTGNTNNNGRLDETEWIHLCVALDGDGAKVYIDGTLVASNSTPGNMGGSGQGLRLGASLIDTAYFRGAYRDFRVYNTFDASIIEAASYPSTMFSLWDWMEPKVAQSINQTGIATQKGGIVYYPYGSASFGENSETQVSTINEKYLNRIKNQNYYNGDG